MAANNHQTSIYVGLAGEGQYMAEGGLYRYAESTGEWQSMTKGLPPTPQVRALLIHPDNPAVLYAGTQCGPYRSDDRGEHWEALEAPPIRILYRRDAGNSARVRAFVEFVNEVFGRLKALRAAAGYSEPKPQDRPEWFLRLNRYPPGAVAR